MCWEARGFVVVLDVMACLAFPDILPLHTHECLQVLKIGYQIKWDGGKEQERNAD